MEKVDVGRMGGNKKSLRRLHTRVTAQIDILEEDYIMDDIKRALLGDHEAAKRLTDAGVLVPCPFCGGEAMVEYDTIAPFEYVVFCGDCGVMTTTSEDEQVARLAWNTRAKIGEADEHSV